MTHRVVRATARSDLLGLVDAGYLDYARRGRVYVFTSRPGWRGMLKTG